MAHVRVGNRKRTMYKSGISTVSSEDAQRCQALLNTSVHLIGNTVAATAGMPGRQTGHTLVARIGTGCVKARQVSIKHRQAGHTVAGVDSCEVAVTQLG